MPTAIAAEWWLAHTSAARMNATNGWPGWTRRGAATDTRDTTEALASVTRCAASEAPGKTAIAAGRGRLRGVQLLPKALIGLAVPDGVDAILQIVAKPN